MTSPLDAAKLILLRVPLLVKTAFLHVFGISPTSQKWDLRTALIVSIIRDVLGNSPASTVTEQQQRTLRDPGVKGGLWVSRVSIPAPPEDAVRDALFQSIRALGTGEEQYSRPSVETVTAEWTGYRANVRANEPEPPISEADKYQRLMDETSTKVTVLYFHGGSYYLMDPCSQREITATYAKMTGGRVLSVRYRLAPQNPFPSALLDALVVYLSLLYPPKGSVHDPVPASCIVIAGDSAGGNLATVLLQLILQIRRNATVGEIPTVMFHDRPVEVPLPAGVALGSPSMDLTHSMRYSEYCGLYDCVPGPKFKAAKSPPCDIWPTDPPRAELFCEGSALCHPLVSPLAAPSWEGAPPIFIVCGEEFLTDECKLFVQKAASHGVQLVWQQYEAMPHCFPHFLQGTPVSRRSLGAWAEFAKMVVQNPGGVAAKGELIIAKTLETTSVDIDKLLNKSEEDILGDMKNARNEIVRDAAEFMWRD